MCATPSKIISPASPACSKCWVGGLAPGSIMARSESILAALFGAGGNAVVAGLIGDYAGIRAESAVALLRRGGVPNFWAYGGMCERHCPVPYTAPQAQCQWLR